MARDRKRQRLKKQQPSGETANTVTITAAAHQQHPVEASNDNVRDHGAATANMANPTATSTSIQRQFLEVNYMGTTRAVVGHGFHVRELLFGDDFVSLRITAPISDADKLRLFCASVVAYQVAQGLVDHAEMDATLATKGATTTEASMTVHLTSKRCALPFMRCVDTLRTTVDGLVVEPLRTPTSKQLIAQPTTFTTMSRAGHIDVKWATGIATGGAELHFATAGAANGFLRGYYMKKLQLPPVKIRLVGNCDDGTGTGNEDGPDRLQLPPYKRAYLDPSRTHAVRLFDEDKISQMTTTQVDRLEFVVKIESGLPLHVDEATLMEMVRLHRVVWVKIHRREPKPAVPLENQEAAQIQAAVQRDARRHRTLPLLACLTSTEEPLALMDKRFQQAGARVHFSNWGRLDQVRDHVSQSPLWTQMDQPCGQPVILEIEYTFQATLAKDLYECFRSKFAAIRAYARYDGVFWTVDKNASGRNTVEITCRSRTRKTLAHFVQSIDCAIECENFAGADLSAVFAMPTRYKRLKNWVADVKRIRKDVCVYINTREKVIRIYGESAAREEIKRLIKELCRTMRLESMAPSSSSHLNHKRSASNQGAAPQIRPYCMSCAIAPSDEPLVTLTSCSHTLCVPCVQPSITPPAKPPLICPVENCGSRIHVKNIMELTDDLGPLVQAAAGDYIFHHPEECVICPQSGCHQILSRMTAEPNEQKLDEQLIWCGMCKQSHSIARADYTKTAMSCGIESYTDVGCNCNHQAPTAEIVDGHVQYVRNRCFVFHCPHCNTPFEPSNETSVVCDYESCQRTFCALCLEFSSLDSTATNDHALQCLKNPQRGSRAASAQEVASIHREHRTSRLYAYLEAKVEDHTTLRVVLQRIAQDLSAHGIASPY